MFGHVRRWCYWSCEWNRIPSSNDEKALHSFRISSSIPQRILTPWIYKPSLSSSEPSSRPTYHVWSPWLIRRFSLFWGIALGFYGDYHELLEDFLFLIPFIMLLKINHGILWKFIILVFVAITHLHRTRCQFHPFRVPIKTKIDIVN